MVGAVVVRTIAFPAGIFAIVLNTTGSNSQRFAITMRSLYGIAGPTVLNMARVAWLRRAGSGVRRSRPTASATMVTAFSGAGIDECPPGAFAVSRRVR